MSRLKFLDGLRGWGAVVVLLYHVLCNGLPINALFSDHLRLLVPLNGTLAVLIFFLVSGWSLSARYLADGDFEAWLRILTGRYLRLAIPIFGACLIVHFVMVFGWVSPPGERLPLFREAFNFDPTLAHLVKFSLLDVFYDYNLSETYIGPLWTMSIELQGSFLVLLAIVMVGRLAGRGLLLFGFGCLVLWLSPTATTAMLALFPIGAALADAFSRGWVDAISKPIALLLLLTGCAAPILLPYGVTAWGLFGAFALTLGSIGLPRTRAWLSAPLSVHLGKISFSLYLMHGPVLCFLGEPLMRHYGTGLPMQLLVQLAIVVCSFVAAYAFLPVNELAIAVAQRFAKFVVNPFFVSPAPAQR